MNATITDNWREALNSIDYRQSGSRPCSELAPLTRYQTAGANAGSGNTIGGFFDTFRPVLTVQVMTMDRKNWVGILSDCLAAVEVQNHGYSALR